jgi:signal transduction histidine kinase
VSRAGAWRIPVLALAAGGLLALVVWLDFQATRSELLRLLRDQAASLRGTVAAAARSNREAGRLAEEQLAARLLDNARLLRELDAHGVLDDAELREVVERHGLFRVNVYSAEGELVRQSGGPHGGGHGHGPGSGFGPGAAGLVQRLLEGGEEEFVSELHTPRSGAGARIAAGVRRARGGAIVLNVDASELAGLLRQGSLESLLTDIARSAPEVVYVAYQQGPLRIAKGPVPDDAPLVSDDASAERVLAVGGRPILDVAGRVEPGTDGAVLRLGLRLDGLRAAERRMLTALALTLLASTGLAALGLSMAFLRRRYALLSAEHQRAQDALRRRDRLAAMGELASTVAHEVRNPLNAIAMSAKRLKREFLGVLPESDPERAELDELLGVVANESGRIDRIVRQFLDFARPPQLAPRDVDLAALLAEVAASLQARAAQQAVALEVTRADAGLARVDADRLREVLDNLVRNALEATPAGGRVTLAARREPGGHVLEVSDTGAGIPPETLPRIFDLYFTTKPDGTGVGLAVAQQIVAAHGGTIEVDSQPGRGTRMTVRLPQQGREAERG